jgi:hypothetical protein
MSGKTVPPAQPSKASPPIATRTTPAQAANTATLQPKQPGGNPTENDIRARAFSLWQQAGCPEGDGIEYWLRAEQELKNPL